MAEKILIVDDHRTSRMKLSMAVKALGYDVDVAKSGIQALDLILHESFDLVLLDIIMPEMDGFEVLSNLRSSNSANIHLPVVVVSAVDDLASAARAIELGAEDYLPKNFDPILLKARISSSLEKKRLNDELTHQLSITRELFGKFVPTHIAQGVLRGEGDIEPVNKLATIMFTDIVGFTAIVEKTGPTQVADMMGEYYNRVIDQVEIMHGVIHEFHGDSMLITFNLPLDDPHHADNAVQLASNLHLLSSEHTFAGVQLHNRIGIATGEIFAAPIGAGSRLHYAIHGDAVNVASRLEQLNKNYETSTLISGSTEALLTEDRGLEPIGRIAIRGHSDMDVYKA